MNCLVAGAGGFIGGHLVRRLLDEGHHVRAVDKKHPEHWWQAFLEVDNCTGYDLREPQECYFACKDMDRVYNLACDMGGIGFITANKADCMVSVLINTNLLRAAIDCKIERYFYSSSACVYHEALQANHKALSLAEPDAYYKGGAMPEDGYGWEKLFSERMCRHFQEDYGLQTRVARFHNIYGPNGSWNDGREKAPAALCRKVAEAKKHNSEFIEIWGDGKAQRSFCYIDDCVDGILKLTDSSYPYPVNIGSDEVVSVLDLVNLIGDVANYPVKVVSDLTKPIGVNGRNSDNTLIKQILKWEPSTKLSDGLKPTYEWIEQRVLGGTL